MPIELADMRNIHRANPDRAKEIWFSVGIPSRISHSRHLTESLDARMVLRPQGTLTQATISIPSDSWWALAVLFYAPNRCFSFSLCLCSCISLQRIMPFCARIMAIGEVAHNTLIIPSSVMRSNRWTGPRPRPDCFWSVCIVLQLFMCRMWWTEDATEGEKKGGD